MKYDRFEDLPVWKSAIDLAVGVYALTKHRAFRGPGDLCSQLRRAALSVSNNIAEGFERGTTAELLTFLYIARGSAGEVRSMLDFVERLLKNRLVEGRSGDQPSEVRGSSERGSDDARLSARSACNTKPNGRSTVASKSADPNSQVSNLKSLAESCSRQIRAWAEKLQDTDIKGQRHLTANTRKAYESDRRADRYWKQLDEAMKARWQQASDGENE